MKRIFAVFMILALLCTGLASASAEVSKKPKLGDLMPDFSVTTLDGSTFTLSEALNEKELVLVNFWATWCGPCKLEFPFMQAAYEKYKDRVAVIALSVEATDTMDKLRAFAEERGLSFPIGRDPGLNEEYMFAWNSIPTSILVDRFGKIVYMQSGTMPGEALFTSLFDEFLGDEYTETKVRARYTIYFMDTDQNVIEGCDASFCTETNCYPVTSNAQGIAAFTGTPKKYHVQIIDYPEEFVSCVYADSDGTWTCTEDGEIYTGDVGGTAFFFLLKEGEE